MSKLSETDNHIEEPLCLSKPLVIAGFALSFFVFFLNISYYWPQTIDDAFITYRYSYNLVHGHGLSYNPGGEWVEGFTNPTWMLLHTIPIALGLSPVLFSKILGFLCGLGTLIILRQFIVQIRQKSDGIEFVPVLLMACFSSFTFWCVQGLETPLFVLCVLTTCWILLRAIDGKNSIYWTVPLALLTVLTRIDGLWFLVFSVPVLLLRVEVIKEKLFPILSCLGFFIIGLIIIQFIRYGLFGDWLPNTAYAKEVSSEVSRARGLTQIFTFYFFHGLVDQSIFSNPSSLRSVLSGFFWLNLIWLSVGVVGLFGSWQKKVLVLFPIFWVCLYVYVTNGDWMPGFRFFQVSVPFLFLSVALALDHINQFTNRIYKTITLFLAGLLSIGILYEQQRIDAVYIFDKNPLWYRRETMWFYPQKLIAKYYTGYGVALGDVSKALNENIPSKSSIMMSDIGLPGWLMLDVSIVDVDGLTNKGMAGAPSYYAREMVESGQHLNHYVNELMLSDERPDAILAFEQHFGNGPDIRGYVYPRAVDLAIYHSSFTLYEEKWRGVKAEGDVWNHLYLKKESGSDDEFVSLERYARMLKLTPRIGTLIPAYYEQLREKQIFRSSDYWKILETSVIACAGDRDLMTRLYAMANLAGDYKFVAFLESVAFNSVKESDYWKSFAPAPDADSMFPEF